MTMEQIQDRLKQLRKRLDLKQRDVAERLEMNVGTVGAWECGSEKIPKTRIYQICKEYNVRKEWLIDGEGEMFVKEEMSPAMLKKQILLIYNSLPEDYQRAFCEVAKAISDAKSLDESREHVESAIQGIVNNSPNYGHQNVDIGR